MMASKLKKNELKVTDTILAPDPLNTFFLKPFFEC